MIKHILDTTEQIIEGSLAYQQFSKDLSKITIIHKAKNIKSERL